jgi:hypothetical protein
MFEAGFALAIIGLAFMAIGFNAQKKTHAREVAGLRHERSYGRYFRTPDGVMNYSNSVMKLGPSDPGPPISMFDDNKSVMMHPQKVD